MRTLIIGGTGHIGRFLIPQLLQQGSDVLVLSRGRTQVPDATVWKDVELIPGTYKRGDKDWCELVAGINPAVVVDILGVDVPGTYAAVKATVQHYVACGSIWMYGPPRIVPTPEQTQGPCQFEWYATRYEDLHATLSLAEDDGAAFTAIMPPNICGPGKVPIECSGGRDVGVHKAHARGEPVKLPTGCNTLIGPCDASDIAQGFALAIANPERSAGQVFNVGSSYALTVPQLVETYAEIYQSTIPIEYVDPEAFYSQVLPDPSANYHFQHHMVPDISKIASVLGYAPQFTPEESMSRAVAWMREERLI
jgi:nucleoside-diphosphate-sugar epimerase